ncbi:MAG: hypothetical protein LBG73_10690 [Spirochaetaceae bacterium]|jgi:hypothetical protein|nr:hypothetical protein [Spirochaetaceae bacterium]
MKKPITPRFLGLLAVYIGVLLLLGAIQFAEKGYFTRQVGGISITGHYRSQEHPNQYELAGTLTVVFGGMEFSINGEADGFKQVKPDGTKEPTLPESMLVSNEAITLEFPGGTNLIFALIQTRGKPELAISAVLPPEIARIELPYKPIKAAKLQELADGQFMLVTDGVRYRFDRNVTNAERHALILQQEGASISYKTVPEEQELTFNAKDFIIPQAHDKQTYERVLSQWREQNFGIWGRNIASANNEDLVIAYTGEAVSRGAYSTAVSSVPAAFLNGNRRTYESSVFLGRLDQGLRSLVTAERDTAGELARLIAEGSLDFLKEPHVFEYLIIRGAWDAIAQAAQLIQSLTPDKLSPERIAGILEGYADWTRYQSDLENARLPTEENPFEPHTAGVYLIIAEGLYKTSDGDAVLTFFEDTADIEFNLRLGKALMYYAENVGNIEWSAIGRSLILSALGLADDAGTVAAKVFRGEDGNLREDADSPRFSSARLYRVLNAGESYPHAVRVSADIWGWTAATALAITEENNVVDIAVTFPVGETHYMLIRGVPQPSKLQLYGIDYRTAPDFERYNSSGWSYSSAEQTLMVKLRHRSPIEHMRIFR